jgi:hypothetical protein
MKMTNKELTTHLCSEVASIKKNMEGVNFTKIDIQLQQLDDNLKEMMGELKKIMKDINDPEGGLIVATNKNTKFRETCEVDRVDTLDAFKHLQRWSSGVNKGLWVMFSVVAGIIMKLIFWE